MIGLAVLLFVLGLAFAFAEVLVPSFGLFTVLSIVSLAASVLLAFQAGSTAGILFVAATVVLIPVTLAAAFRLLRRSRLGRRLLLQAPDSPQGVAEIYAANRRFLGKMGRSVTPLRPSGTAEFDGERVPVVTEGEHVPAGRRLEVVAVEGNRIVVRTLDPEGEEEEDF